MCRVCPCLLLIFALLISSLGQADDIAEFNLTDEQISAIKDLRHNACSELDLSGRQKFTFPDVALAFFSRSAHLAIVSISGVEGTANPGDPIQLTLQINELLRGTFDVPEIRTKSDWKQGPDGNVFIFGRRPTALDTTEPKLGARYLIGFEAPTESKGVAFISAAASLQDPDYAQLFTDVQRFLSVETRAAEG